MEKSWWMHSKHTGGNSMCYFIGIDVAKYKHDFIILTDKGEIVQSPTTFSNNEAGFKELLDSLSKLDHSQEIKIGLESTGHYHKNLVKFLEDNNYQTNILNAYLVHKFIEARTLRKQKNDKLDCRWIAEYLQSVEFKTYQNKSYTSEQLKSLTRERDKLVLRRNQEYVDLTNALDLIFPEFKMIFDNRFSKTAIFLLNEYPSAKEISKISTKDLDKFKKKHKGTRLNKISSAIAQAKATIGHPNESISFIIKTVTKLIIGLTEVIEDYEKQISKLLDKMNTPLLSIAGVGKISAAAIIGEYNNFDGFPDADKLLAFAGLECSRYQSGESDYHGKMVKRGSPHLRYVLMNLAIALKNFNPLFHTYYLKKKEEGKPYRVALNHVVRKFLRVAFKLVSTNTKFDINLAK